MLMNSTSILHVRNPLPALRRIFRQGLLLSALGAFLLIGAAASAAQQNANMLAVQSPASPQPLRIATSTQQKLADIATAEGVQIEWNAGLGTPSSLRGENLGERRKFLAGQGLQLVGQPDQDALAVLDNLSGIMGIRTAAQEFTAMAPEADALGYQHVRATQMFQGLKVFGGQLLVHFNRDGKAYQVNGRYVPDINVDVIPQITPDDAMHLAAEDLAALGKGSVTIKAPPELVVFAWNTAPRLAYALTLTCDPAVENIWRFWIDAQDGTVLMRYNDVKLATITGNILSGEGGGTTNVNDCYTAGGTNYLWGTNLMWQIYNASTNTIYVDHASLTATNIAWRTNNPWTPADSNEISAAVNFDHIQQYYSNVHYRSSYDNNGSNALAYVHYGNNLVNAFWSPAVQAFLFGDGDGTSVNPLTVLDVAGHEFTHAVTEYSANLIYAYEPGALNESFSDIFGACVEFYSQPDGRANYPSRVAGTADWLMGEDCWLSSTALRDLRNPANAATVGAGSEQPTHYKGTYWYTGTLDNGGVHQNSGVQNYFFYLLSEGGSVTNNGVVYNVTGIGVTNAAQIAYRALTVYCYVFTDYAEIRTAWLSAAQDLNPAWATSVIQAWDAVGFSADTTSANFGIALNSTYLTWYTGSNYPWFVETTYTHDGAHAVQSGPLSDEQQSRIYTTAAGGPGTLTFWWRVSSETNFDFLSFYIDNQLQERISGTNSPWINCTYSITNGSHEIKWVYSKDESVSVGVDAGWLDEVTWMPDWHPPAPVVIVSAGNYIDRIAINWSALSGTTLYRLYRNTVNDFAGASLIFETTGTGYNDTGVGPVTIYYYWVIGINAAASSPLSSVQSGYRNLAVPSGLTASAGDWSGYVRLAWNASPCATAYRILRNTVADFNSAAILTETGGTTLNDTSALPGVTYYYWIIARKWDPTINFASALSDGVSGWRRSMAATDNAFCDFDGDGKADPAVYQQTTGLWKIMMSANRYRITSFTLGGAGYLPVPQDFDGDGKTDIAVYSQTTGKWMALLSAYGYGAGTLYLGGTGYIPRARDYDGDGKADPTVFQQSSGLWKAMLSSQGYALAVFSYGDSGYSICPADYDGDGKTDPAMFQVRQVVMGKMGYWFAAESANGYATTGWTISTSGQAVPQDYDGDRLADMALYDSAASLWSYWPSSIISPMPFSLTIGGAGFVSVAGDYDGDKEADFGVYQESTGNWVVRLSGSSFAPSTFAHGGNGYQAAAALP